MDWIEGIIEFIADLFGNNTSSKNTAAKQTQERNNAVEPDKTRNVSSGSIEKIQKPQP